MKITELEKGTNIGRPRKYTRKEWGEGFITVYHGGNIDYVEDLPDYKDGLDLDDFQADDWMEVLEGQALRDERIKQACKDILGRNEAYEAWPKACEILAILNEEDEHV